MSWKDLCLRRQGHESLKGLLQFPHVSAVEIGSSYRAGKECIAGNYKPRAEEAHAARAMPRCVKYGERKVSNSYFITVGYEHVGLGKVVKGMAPEGCHVACSAIDLEFIPMEEYACPGLLP